MRKNRLCFISRNYYNLSGAGNKAKVDNEDTLLEMGAVNLGLHRTVMSSKILAFFLDLAGIIRACALLQKDDVLFLQYPVKKYFAFLCNVARWKGARTVSLIHDIGSIRTHRLTPQQEVNRLSNSDYIIASNDKMVEWLKTHGMRKPMGWLGIFDYRAPFFNQASQTCPSDKETESNLKIVYAGALHIKKNPFLIQLSQKLTAWNLIIYGNKEGLSGWKENSHIIHKGFAPSDEFIRSVKADFGLVWDGDSLETCSGVFGEYLRWNSPHKVSFYLRAGLPIIIWKEAAVTSILEKEGVCIAISTLQELEEKLKALTPNDIAKLKLNAKHLAERLNHGYFLRQALDIYSNGVS